mgnify:CR=1 FL=1
MRCDEIAVNQIGMGLRFRCEHYGNEVDIGGYRLKVIVHVHPDSGYAALAIPWGRWSRRWHLLADLNWHSADPRILHVPSGAKLGHLTPEAQRLASIRSRNVSEFSSLVCRSPPLDEALGRHDHRAVVRTVGVRVTINADHYGPPINYSYYPR